MENIYKVHPEKIEIFYKRFLRYLDEYPITKQKYFELNLRMMKKKRENNR